MLYPNDFYFTEKSSESLYGVTPPGQLNVSRLVTGLSPWKKPALQEVQQPKTLIITDWTAENWTIRHRNKMIGILRELLANGFVIHLWQNGDLVQLSQDNLDSLLQTKNALEKITPEDDKTITAIAKIKLTISEDKLLLVDDFWLKTLETGRKIRTIETDKIKRTTHSRGKIIEKLLSATPAPEGIINTVFYYREPYHLDARLIDAAKRTIINSYDVITLDDKRLNELLITGTTQDPEKNPIRIEDLNRASGTITLRKCVLTAEMLQRALSHCTRADALIVEGLHINSADEAINLPSLPNLNRLQIELKKSPGNKLIHLSRAAANVVELNISNTGKDPFDLSDDYFQWPSLRLISLASIDLNDSSLLRLSQISTNLEEMNLSSCTLPSPFNSQCNFSSLKKLSLGNMTITAEQLSELIHAAKNLESIELHACKIIGRNRDFGTTTIKNFRLNKCDLEPGLLPSLLAATPHLDSFMMTDNGNLLYQEMADLSHPLPHLSTIDIRNSEYRDTHDTTKASLTSQLLAITPNLSKVIISAININKYYKSLLSVQHLDSLTLDKCDLSTEQLRKILNTHYHSLTRLELKNVDLTSELNNLRELPQLNSLSLKGSQVSSKTFLRLLHSTPSLKHLEIDLHDQFDAMIAPPLLNNLETLIVSNTMHEDDLITLLKASPNLKKLNLSNLYTQINLDNPTLKALLSRIPIVEKSIISLRPPHSHTSQTLSDPIHNPTSHAATQPTPPDFKFEYKGENKSLNQSMIIEKLSQYLTLTNQHVEYLPKLKDGMCYALSHLFINLPLNEWNELLKTISSWDGKRESITTQCETALVKILHAFKEYYVDHIRKPFYTYLGESAADYLIQNRHHQNFLLKNPWHAISVKTLDDNHFAIYDPNYPKGFKIVTNQEFANTLSDSIGSIISIEAKTTPPRNAIKDIHSFIREGGMLAIAMNENMTPLIKDIDFNYSFPNECLTGLFLRDTNGHPTWAFALSHQHTQELAAHLLRNFISLNPDDYASLIFTSLNATSNRDRHYYLEQLIQFHATHPGFFNQEEIDAIRDTINHEAHINEYGKYLETWRREKPQSANPSKYLASLTSTTGINQLIELNRGEDVKSLNLLLERRCLELGRPVFYINSPEDLICSAPYIQREGQTGHIQTGPGGKLHDFLTASHDPHTPPVLIINYDKFKPDDIVRFNGLLDKHRHADGTPLPQQAIVIGLMNTNSPHAYQGEDFYSRFDQCSTCPLSSAQLSKAVPPLPLREKLPSDHEKHVINLHHADNWKERLLGHWIIQGNQLHFESGELISALQSNKPIEIQNGRWDDPEFKLFWETALLHRQVEIAGEQIPVPASLQLIKSDGNNWQSLTHQTSWSSEMHHGAVTVNPTRFSLLFTQYHCDNTTKQLHTLPGIIQSNANRDLHVNITRALNEDEWAMLLTECQQYQVKLFIHALPTVQLPESLKRHLTIITPTPQPSEHAPNIITSTDVDVTTNQLVDITPDSLMIDVSGYTSSDLLSRISAEFNTSTRCYQFTEIRGALLTALTHNKKIILKGRFTPELCDELSDLLLSGKIDTSSLTLITEKPSPFSLPIQRHHEVSIEEKLSSLQREFTSLPPFTEKQLADESLARLIARTAYYQATQDTNNDAAWQGMLTLPIHIDHSEIDERTTEKEASDFISHRLHTVNNHLAASPFIFLTGLTAVGKSTFVEKYLPAENRKLYHSESAISDWAKDRSDQQKILFIDEANITARDWSEFEGLFNHPPSIIINGEYVELTNQHKVVFAGNPVSYGSERKLSPFFMRHGNAVLFEPMTPAFIYETILKPIFQNTPLEKDAFQLSEHFLTIYQFICKLSTNEILISPRELQMMALLTLSHCSKSKDDPTIIAQHYAYQLAHRLVPKQYQTVFAREFKPDTNLSIKQTEPNIASDFLITSSRQTLSNQLNDLLSLRELRNQTDNLNDGQRYGGLGGIIIEGEPGIGKSELVIAALIAKGYKQIHHAAKSTCDKPFYRLPVSMPLDEKKTLLMQAFHEGAVVVIDEINSSPMMERLLNDLLMGKTPDGKRPDHPGFMVIGTQNPPTLAGRRNPSNALARRLIQTELTPYSNAEMRQILEYRGLDSARAHALVSAYDEKKLQAKREKQTPEPTFRDLLRLADQVIRGSLKSTEVKQLEQDAYFLSQLQSILQKNEYWHRVMNSKPLPSSFVEYIKIIENPHMLSHAKIATIAQLSRHEIAANKSASSALFSKSLPKAVLALHEAISSDAYTNSHQNIDKLFMAIASTKATSSLTKK